MILVTGANSNVGSEVTRQLAAKGRSVRAMVRKLGNAAKLPRDHVEVVIGSFSDRNALDSAMKGVDAVFMISFEHPDQIALQGNVIAAAKREGVRLVARLSAAGADPDSENPIMSNHGKGDRQLVQSGLGYVVVQPDWFNQEFLVDCPGGIIRRPAGDACLPFVDVRDIAAVTVETLTGAGCDGQAHVLTGPDALNHTEIAAILSEATGKRFVYEDVPLEAYRQDLLEAGAPEYYADLITKLFAFVRSGGAGGIHDGVQRVLGRPAITFRQFAHDFSDELTRQLV
jgi:uncharacterized protein YbjT (DUF2867 family)